MRQHQRADRTRRQIHAWRGRPLIPGTVVAGVLALCWLLFRSGSKPSRLAYPCQRAALSTASLAFGAPLVAILVAVRRRWRSGRLKAVTLVVAVFGLAATAGLWSYLSQPGVYAGPQLDPPGDYRAQVFHTKGPTAGTTNDRFANLDDLIEIMGGHGVKFYQSATTSLTAGVEGLIAADDVVIVKINYQWPERGGTNVDLLRGLIRRIVDHPDGFTGEVVVCENTQFASIDNFDRAENNAEEISLSPHDVVLYYQSLGYRVSHYDWTAIRFTSVGEYSAGNMSDGYVVYPYDAALQGRVSYPKFQTAYGTRISLRDGIWDPVTGYDPEPLKFINVPVLKSHHATYGATASVKNYMGVVTRELSTNSHAAIRYGILGALLGEVRPADLNLLDCTWINADPFDGPWTTYEAATRTDMLVASRDPVAADIWSVKNVLLKAFVANGYQPPWPPPSADPDDPSSSFRQYLDASMNYLLAAGYDATNDLTRIDAINLAPPGEASDPAGGGEPFTISEQGGAYELHWSDPVRGGAATEFVLYRMALPATGATLPECETNLGNGTSAVLGSLPDNHGFLVVGRNGVGDGSFGRGHRGAERPSPAEQDVCP
jgi:hypothetical protein